MLVRRIVLFIIFGLSCEVACRGGSFMLVSHRGAGFKAPENTVVAMKKTLELDVEATEIDIRRCKSGELVLMHDETIDRVTGSTGLVKDKTLQELRTLKVENKEPVATFREALDALEAKRSVIIDVKDERTAADIASTVTEYAEKRGWKWEQFWAIGLLHDELVKLKKLCPKIRLVPVVMGAPLGGVEYLKKMGAEAVCVTTVSYAQEFTHEAQNQGIKVWFGAPGQENKEVLTRYKAEKLDGAILDDLDLWKTIQ